MSNLNIRNPKGNVKKNLLSSSITTFDDKRSVTSDSLSPIDQVHLERNAMFPRAYALVTCFSSSKDGTK